MMLQLANKLIVFLYSYNENKDICNIKGIGRLTTSR